MVIEVVVAHLAEAADPVVVNHPLASEEDHTGETTTQASSSFLMVTADTEVDALTVVPLVIQAMRDAAHKRNALRRLTGLWSFWPVLLGSDVLFTSYTKSSKKEAMITT